MPIRYLYDEYASLVSYPRSNENIVENIKLKVKLKTVAKYADFNAIMDFANRRNMSKFDNTNKMANNSREYASYSNESPAKREKTADSAPRPPDNTFRRIMYKKYYVPVKK